MRKLLAVTAMVLASVIVQDDARAGQSRSLSVASVDEPATTTQDKLAATSNAAAAAQCQPAAIRTAEAGTADASTSGASAATATGSTSAATAPSTTAPATAPAQPQAIDAARAARSSHRVRASGRRHNGTWSEARIVGELHRHGIYW